MRAINLLKGTIMALVAALIITAVPVQTTLFAKTNSVQTVAGKHKHKKHKKGTKKKTTNTQNSNKNGNNNSNNNQQKTNKK